MNAQDLHWIENWLATFLGGKALRFREYRNISLIKTSLNCRVVGGCSRGGHLRGYSFLYFLTICSCPYLKVVQWATWSPVCSKSPFLFQEHLEWPLMLHNHSSVFLPDEKELLVIGGGGNCFSFGTHLNPGPVLLSLSSILISDWVGPGRTEPCYCGETSICSRSKSSTIFPQRLCIQNAFIKVGSGGTVTARDSPAVAFLRLFVLL